MPIYEYVCRECGHEYEKLVRMTQADEPQRCPACAGEQSRRMLSQFAMGSTGGSLAGVAAGPPARSPFT